MLIMVTKKQILYCPACYQDLIKVEEINGQKICPRCGTVVIQDRPCIVKCSACNRIFTSVILYHEHILWEQQTRKLIHNSFYGKQIEKNKEVTQNG